MHQQKYKVYYLIILVFIILNNSCENIKRDYNKGEIDYGWRNRMMESRLPMNCSEDNLAIYNEDEVFIFKLDEYKILSSDLNIGLDDFHFKIAIYSNKEIVENFYQPSISFCKNGKVFHGRGMMPKNSLKPAACHFFYSYDSYGRLSFFEINSVVCSSHKFLTPKEYAKKVLGVEVNK